MHIPTPTGNAIAIPATEIAATSSMFERLKMIPPSIGFKILEVLACLILSEKFIPTVPVLPNVNPNSRENRRIPNT
jgi:hypothetical protein